MGLLSNPIKYLNGNENTTVHFLRMLAGRSQSQHRSPPAVSASPSIALLPFCAHLLLQRHCPSQSWPQVSPAALPSKAFSPYLTSSVLLLCRVPLNADSLQENITP